VMQLVYDLPFITLDAWQLPAQIHPHRNEHSDDMLHRIPIYSNCANRASFFCVKYYIVIYKVYLNKDNFRIRP